MRIKALSIIIVFVTELVVALPAMAATLQYDRFAGLSNIADPDVACVSPAGSPFVPGSCGASNVFSVSQGGVGYSFPRFDTSLGTLNSVRFSYNLETGGVWIGRPEDSIFSDSTDFNFTSSVGFYSDHFGNQNNVDAIHPTWNGIDDLQAYFLGPIASSVTDDTIDGGETSGSFNARVNQQTTNWAINLNGFRDFAASDAFLYTEGVNPGREQNNVQVLLAYRLFAGLDGRSIDCEFGTASCGVTNRVTYLSKVKFSVIYDYDVPVVVPLPASLWLFSSGLLALGWVQRRGSGKISPE